MDGKSCLVIKGKGKEKVKLFKLLRGRREKLFWGRGKKAT